MGTDFRNSRGLNLSDPKYDKDAVNLRTLKREVQNIVVGTGATTVGLFEEGSGNNSIVSKDSGSNAGGDYSIIGEVKNRKKRKNRVFDDFAVFSLCFGLFSVGCRWPDGAGFV